jgi:predicted phosphodiesterase
VPVVARMLYSHESCVTPTMGSTEEQALDPGDESVEAVFSETGTFLWRSSHVPAAHHTDFQGSEYLLRPSRGLTSKQRRKWTLITLTTVFLLVVAGCGLAVMQSTARSSARPTTLDSSVHDEADPYSSDKSNPEVTTVSVAPTDILSTAPTDILSTAPSENLSELPSSSPSILPSENPTLHPTLSPTTAPTTPRTIVFYAIGDVPYSEEEAEGLEAQMKHIPDDADFVIHVGDIRSAKQKNDCVNSDYTKVSKILRQSHAPVFLVMGDNEWNDCPNIPEGYTMWRNAFDNFENKYWNSTHLNVRRWQSLPESFVFEFRSTLFIGLNLVGGAVHDKDEWAARLSLQYGMTAELIRRYLDRTSESGIQRVVIFGHADPTSDHNDFFYPLKEFIKNKLENKVPILYVNGDQHEWRYNRNFLGQSSLLRMMLTGGSAEAPLRVQINLDAATDDPTEAFDYERHSYTFR